MGRSDRRRSYLDRLVWAIECRGPSVVLEERPLAVLRRMAKADRPGFLETVWALERAGVDRADIDALVIEHPADCACWQCVLRLQAKMVRLFARFRVEQEEAYRDDLDRQFARLTAQADVTEGSAG